MQMHEIVFLVYFLIVSIISIILTVYDKYASKCKCRRIRERTLIFLALAFGSLSMYITMIFIRHKTRHLKFMIGLPVFIILNALVIYVASYMVKIYG